MYIANLIRSKVVDFNDDWLRVRVCMKGRSAWGSQTKLSHLAVDVPRQSGLALELLSATEPHLKSGSLLRDARVTERSCDGDQIWHIGDDGIHHMARTITK